MNYLTIRPTCTCACATHVQGACRFFWEFEDVQDIFLTLNTSSFFVGAFAQWYIFKCSVLQAMFWHISCVATCIGGGSLVVQAQTQDWGTAAGPVYSAVGLPRSKGNRGCVQGLINHDHFGRDKQAGPSRDAAAPAAGGGRDGGKVRWTAWKERGGCGVVG